MSLIGQTKIIGDSSRPAEGASRAVLPGPAAPDRVQQVADALVADAGAAAAGRGWSGPEPAGEPTGRAADAAGLRARQTALAAALQQWYGSAGGSLRTTALGVLAASGAARVGQEATRAKPDVVEE